MPMFFMNAAKELIPKNKEYKGALQLYVWETYKKDIPKKDITTDYFLLNKKKAVVANITAGEDGVLSGIQEVEWFLKKVGVKINKAKKDGTLIKKGDLIMQLSGPANKILAAERTLLNLLQRMSGIATTTKKLASCLPKTIKLLATRKTFWGALDKRAVVIGGGCTHRLHLSDAVLIKDNHISLSEDLNKSLRHVFKKAKKARFIEIELESTKEVENFLGIYKKIKADLKINQKVVVMLDNFTPANVKKAVPMLKKMGIYVEISGGINEKNIKKYTIKGVSAISTSSITGRAPALDISLHIK